MRSPEAREALLAVALLVLAAGADAMGAPGAVVAAAYAGCYVAGGWRSAVDGVRALEQRRLEVDVLMVLAALGAAALDRAFDGGLLIVIFAVSGAQEVAMHRRTEASVRDLLDLAPEQAVRLGPTGEQIVDAADLRVGDVVVIRPGERVSADGDVVSGASEVDASSVTGEPMPVPRHVGDPVFAGTVNGTGLLHVRVTRPAGQWVLARIAGLVEQARDQQAPTQLLVERVEQRYSVGVVLATLALVAGPLLLGDESVETVLLRAMTFMVVASPCAVVLSTMPPLLAAVAVAGRRGVLVRSAEAMERLAAVRAVALDKTGTLTSGRPEVAAVSGDPRTLAVAAAAEAGSEHPLGRALQAAAGPVGSVRDFRALPGTGVRAVVDGRVVRVGNRRVLPPGADDAGLRDLEQQGMTAVAVVEDEVLLGCIGLVDGLRPEAAGAVAQLRALTGAPVTLLTGDTADSAARVATDTGVDSVQAGLLPEDKGRHLAVLRAAHGPVMFVGDGVNDAAALVAADTGVALGDGGSDLAVENADVVLVRDDLAAVPATLELSRRAVRLVRQNLVFAAVVIAALVALTFTDRLTLPLGVALHEGSTVLIGLNALRLLRRGAWTAEAAAPGPVEVPPRSAPGGGPQPSAAQPAAARIVTSPGR